MLPAQCAKPMALVASFGLLVRRPQGGLRMDPPSRGRFEAFHHWLQPEPETGSFMLQSAGQTEVSEIQ